MSCETVCCVFIRGVGCIFYEMACGRPLFPGSTVEDELYYIFKILGTPTEENFPGISKNEEFLSYNFSQYESENLINVAPRYGFFYLIVPSLSLTYTSSLIKVLKSWCVL